MPFLLAAIVFFATVPCAHAAETRSPEQAAFVDIYRELIEIDTTDSVGDSIRAAEAMAARLRAGGFPAQDIQVLSSGPRKGNLVARLRGSGVRKPLLLLAHLDVVEAKRTDWDSDPFKLNEIDGYFRGRGVIDDKAMAAAFVANMLAYVKEGFKPDRDIILALTADEELSDSPHNGVRWLLQNHRGLIDAELAINEGGGGALRNGRPFRLAVQLAEKIYQTYLLEVTDPGGHSALPRRDNPIYRLAQALRRIEQFDFPPRLNPVTRAVFERMAASETPDTAEAIRALLAGRTDAEALAPLTNRPDYSAQMRTTCVATMLEAGHAENALPQTARATVNCRILPTETAEATRETLVKVAGDSRVAITPIRQPKPSPPSPLTTEVMKPIETITQQMWPGAPVVPVMSTGATDSLYLRKAGVPVYGTSGIFADIDDGRAHGKDERIGMKEFYDGQEYLYRMVKAFASASSNQRQTADK